MNPPRRRRANLPASRRRCEQCQCDQCRFERDRREREQAAAIGAGPDPRSCLRAVADDIAACGWSVSAVLGDETAPPWAYTVGLWLSHGGPELAMFGLPVEHMTVILNSIGDRLTAGEPVGTGDDVAGICPCTLTLRPVHASWRATSMFAISDTFYGYVRPPCLQVTWPDRRGRYPGDAGFGSRYEGRQPMLWLPRDDHPPGPWTRIDRLP